MFDRYLKTLKTKKTMKILSSCFNKCGNVTQLYASILYTAHKLMMTHFLQKSAVNMVHKIGLKTHFESRFQFLVIHFSSYQL